MYNKAGIGYKVFIAPNFYIAETSKNSSVQSNNGVTILQAATWERMSQPLFANSPLTDANAHGFWTDSFSGYAVRKHGGSINNFKSTMALLPELGLGFFVSTNSDSGSALRKIPERVIAEFFPATEETPPEPTEDFAERAERYVGTFFNTRRNQKRFDKVLYIAATDRISVSATDSGYLVLTRGDESARYVEIGQDTFASVNNGSIVQFDGPPNEPASWLYREGGSAYEKPGWSEHRSTLLVPLLLALLAALLVLTRSGWRLIRKAEAPLEPGEKPFSIALNVTAIAWLVTFAALVAAVMPYANNPALGYEPYPTPGFVRFAYLIYASTAGSLVSAVIGIRATRLRQTPLGATEVATRYAAAVFALLPLPLYLWHFYSVV